jgi:fibronectin type 3 domain-containing protein
MRDRGWILMAAVVVAVTLGFPPGAREIPQAALDVGESLAQRSTDGTSEGREEGYADRICDSPQNLTGTVPLLGYSSGYEAGTCSLTWDGSAYGAAWATRSGSTREITFARIAADGTLLLGPVSVSSGTNSKVAPSIAWSGNVYGIAWHEVSPTQEAILFAEVSSIGTVIGSDIPVSANSTAKGAPSLVWSGTQFAMAWDDARSGSPKIYFCRVSEAGIPSPEAQVTTAGSCLNPSLAASSTGFGLSWDGDPDGNREIYFALLTSTGTRIAADVRVTNNSADSRSPSLAWTGTQYGVAWEDERTTVTDIYFARVSGGGAKLGVDVQITSDAASSQVPSLVWTGSEFGVAWLDSRYGGEECFFARISAAGAKVGSDLLLTYNGGDTSMVDLAFGSLGYGLLFKTPDPLYEMSFLGLGCHSDSTAPTCPSSPFITGNSSYGVTISWDENGVDHETEIAYHRVYRNGTAIGETTDRAFTDSPRPAGTPSYRVAAVNANGWESTGCPSITASVPTGDCGEPWTPLKTLTVADAGPASTLVWDGSAYAAVWEAHHQTWFARISSDGALIVPPKTICEAAAYAVTPSLAWTGSEYGVVWSDTRFAGKNLYFTRVDASGNKVGADIQITSDTSLNDNPSLAWNGEAYGVSWEGFLGSTRVYFTLLSAEGAILEPDLAVSTGSGTGTIPSLIWTGANFAVAWQDTRNTHADIYKRAIGRYGSLGTEIRITSDPGNSYNPSLAWTGSELGLAWEDTRGTSRDIYFARVLETGGKQGTEVRVTEAPTDSIRPRLVWTGSEYGVAWQEDRDGDEDVFYATLDASGYMLGGERTITDDAAGLPDEGLALAVGGRGLGLLCALGASTPEGLQYVGLGCGTLDTTPPPCPSLPAESGRTSTSVTLAWGPSFETGGDFGHYAIFKDGEEVAATLGTTWTDTLFDPAAGPVYHVVATNAAGLPSTGCAAVDTTDAVAPACPYGLSFQWLGANLLQLYWMPTQDALSGLRRYRIYRDYSLIAMADPGFIGYTDADVMNSQVYLYEVIAEDWAGNLSSGCAPLSTEDAVPPSCPSGLNYQWLSATSLQLFWYPSQDVGGGLKQYKVYRDSAFLANAPSTATTYVDADTVITLPHHYLVLAEDWAGNLSVGCEPVSTEDLTPPACPGSLQATAISSASVTLSWLAVQDPGSGLKQYKVYRDTVFVGNVPAGTQTYSDAPIVPGTTYLYTVLAEDWAGHLSSACAPLSVTVPDPAGACGEPWTPNIPVAVSAGLGLSGSPAAAWDGAAYGIVWQDDISDNLEIYFARVSPDGAVVVPPVRITDLAGESQEPSIAWNGSEFGVVWQDARTTVADIYFTRIGADGTKVGGDIQVTTDAGSSLNPALVWTGTEYGVAWEDTGTTVKDIYFVRLNAAGAKLEAEQQITSDAASSLHASLAWAETGFGLAWEDTRDGGTEIYFARVSAAGTKVGSDTRITNATGTSEYPSLAWTGSTFGVAWKDSRTTSGDIYFAAISAAGVKAGGDVQVTGDAASSYDPSLVWLGSEFGVAWRDTRSGRMDIFYASLDDYGARLGAERDLSGGDVDDYRPVLVPSGSGAGLIYRANVSGDADEIRFVGLGCGAPDTTAPPCPSSPAIVSRTETSVSLAWGLVSDPDGDFGHYEIYKDGALAAVTLETSWTDSAFNPSAGPVYHILATNAAGLASAGCPAVATEDTVPPPCPGSLQATAISSSSITLGWIDPQDPTSGLKQVKVYRDTLFLGDVPAGAQTYTDTAVLSGSTYLYSILAEDWAGNASAGCASVPVLAADRATCWQPWTGNDPVAVSAGLGLGNPAAAWDGLAYGLVWQDFLSGDDEIYFARVAADGSVVVPPVRLTNAAGDSVAPAIAWNGSEFGVAWQDARTTVTDIYFARVDLQGNKIGSDIQITNDAGSSLGPSLVWTGTEFGLAWDDTRLTSRDLYFVRLDTTGTKLEADRQITTDPASSSQASLVWTGSGYGLAWVDTRDGNAEIYFARLSSAGIKVGSDTRITDFAGTSEFPSLAWTGSGYGVAWRDARTTAGDIYFARISEAGAKMGLDVQVTSDASTSHESSLAWMGDGFGLAWRDNRSGSLDIFYTSLDASGVQLGAPQNLSGGDVDDYTPVLVRGSAGAALVYQADVTGTADEIRFVGLGCGGMDTTPPPCPSSPSVIERSETTVTLGWGPSSDPNGDFGHYAIYKNGALAAVTLETAWTDDSFDPVAGPVYHVVATNAAGYESAGCPAVTTADTVPPACPGSLQSTAVSNSSVTLSWIAVQDTGSGLKQYKVYRDAAFMGNGLAGTTTYTDSTVVSGTTYGYTVLAEDFAGNLSAGCAPIQVTAADQEGACGVPWTETIPIMTISGIANEPSIAWDGAAYGVAWMDTRDGNYEIYFARVSPDGTVIVAPTRITDDAAGSFNPSLVWTGVEYGVAWYDQRTPTYDIYFARIGVTGNKIGADVQITADPADSVYPSLVWTGAEYGVAWKDTRTTASDIYFTRISAAGAKVCGDVQITSDAGETEAPSLAWADTQYGVAWADTRSTVRDIYFALISAAGVKTTLDVQITSDPDESYEPSLAWTGSEFGVAWWDTRSLGFDIYFARISSAGEKVGSDVAVSTYPMGGSTPSLVWKDTGYSLAWKSSRTGTLNIFFASLDASGAKVGADRNLSNSGAQDKEPALARGGDGLGVVYHKDIAADELYFVGLGCGEPDVTPPPCPSSPSVVAQTSTSVTLAWGPSPVPEGDFGHYAIYKDGVLTAATMDTTWTDTSFDPAAGPVYHVLATNAAGVQSAGCPSVLTTDTIPPTCPTGFMVSAVSNSSVTLAWLESQDAGSGLKQYRFFRDGIFLTNIALGTTMFTDSSVAAGTTYAYSVLAEDWAGNLSTGCSPVAVTAQDPPVACGEPWTGPVTLASSSWAEAPSAAWDGAAFGVVWRDDRNGNSEIYFSRVTASGTVLVAPIRVTYDTSFSQNPSLVWAGSAYGLSWTDGRTTTADIYFTRLDTSGNRLSGEIQITSDASISDSSSLVWTGSEYGVAWTDNRLGNPEIYFAKIDAYGTKLTSDIQMSNLGGNSGNPSLVHTGNQYALAWQNDAAGHDDIYFARVSNYGIKIGSDLRVTTDAGASRNPSLAWTGTEYGLAWDDSRNPTREIYFARISATGDLLSSNVRVTNDAAASDAPSLVWKDGQYLVAWSDWRMGRPEMFVASLDPGGLRIGSERRLTSSYDDDVQGTLAASGHGIGLFYKTVLDTLDQIRFMGLGCGEADTSPPTCPGYLTVTDRNSMMITLSWMASVEAESDFSHFTVYKNGAVAITTLSTTWTDWSFDPSNGTVYLVTATNAAGLESPNCAIVDTADTVPPTCVDGLMATVSTGPMVMLNWIDAWDSGSGIQEYRIYRNGMFVGSRMPGANMFMDMPGADATYAYVIETVDWAGNQSSGCSAVWVYTGGLTLHITKNPDHLNADLDWNDAGLSQYVVYRSTSPQVGYEHQRVPLSETRDNVLEDGVKLWFYYIQQRE